MAISTAPVSKNSTGVQFPSFLSGTVRMAHSGSVRPNSVQCFCSSSNFMRLSLRFEQFIDHTNGIGPDSCVICVQMGSKVFVKLQPPEGRVWNQEVACAFRPERFEVGDRRCAVRGVMAGIVASVGLRKVPC